MEPTSVERLSRVEFEQLSADEQSEHVEATLSALRMSIPHSGASAGAFIDVRLYVDSAPYQAAAEEAEKAARFRIAR